MIGSPKPELGRREAMHKLFSPIVKGLNAPEYVSEEVAPDTQDDPPFTQSIE